MTQLPMPISSTVQQTPEPYTSNDDCLSASFVPDDLHALRAAVEGTAAGTGEEFFRSLVRHLAEAIGVRYAVVAEFPKAPPHVRTLAFWENGRIADNFEYDFTGTPCAEIVRGELVHYPTGVSELFPQATPLVERGIDSYMAVLFRDGARNILGHLAVFDERPMPAEPHRMSFFQIFAARASAELQRLRAEQRVQESETRFRHLFENAPNAYFTVGTDLRILDVNRRVTEMLGYSVEELIGATIHSFLPDTPAGKTLSEKVHLRHIAGESVSGWELEMQHKTGRPVVVNLWMEGGRGEDGTIQPARAICVDITERVLAERERARLQEQTLYLQEEIKSVHNFEKIIGRCPPLIQVLGDVARVAPTDSTVLITGETGTGKELFARAIHSASKRQVKPLIKVNCATLPSGLVESELFGHEKGAFSGAINKRLGRFELADGGTIFLDEIGELPAEAQVKLLRVLQEREFDRVGGTAPIRVDVRVIAATNRDLQKEVHEKRFREDLYYRLNVFPARLPPLRERKEDIPLLVHFLINKFTLRIGKPIDGVSRQTMQQLKNYAWPGNIRELENVLERAIILATGSTLDISPELLPASTSPASTESLIAAVATAHSAGEPLTPTPEKSQRSLEIVERDHIRAILEQNNWLVTGPRGAARVLGLNPSTLRNRMKKLGLKRAPD
jgi:formate hydrogenlyase transcriptional activator